MTRTAGILALLALLLLTASASAQTVSNDIGIIFTQIRPTSLGSALLNVATKNQTSVPMTQPVDLVVTLHGNATLSAQGNEFTNCTAESPQTVRCRNSLTVPPGGGAAAALTISQVTERRVALVARATWTVNGEERTTEPVVTTAVFPRGIEVTNNGDEGPGSLRAAIEYANANCTGIPCEILFRLTPVPNNELPGAFATIMPNTPLPAITAPDFIIDGATQAGFGGLGPKVTLTGAALWYGSGLDFAGTGLFTVRNLIVRRFPWDGIAVSRRNDDPLWRSTIAENFLVSNGSRGIIFNPPASRVDVERNVIVSNFRSGVFIEGGRDITVDRNTVYDNRASGVYVSAASEQVDVSRNELRHNGHWGVTIGRGARLVELIDNRIYENHIAAIDVGVDGPDFVFEYAPARNRVGAPALTEAFVDPVTGFTHIRGAVNAFSTGTWDITLYSTSIAGSAHGVLGHVTAQGDAFELILPYRLMPGTFVIASAVHRLDGREWQTEMSNHVTVFTPPPD
jgi:parallel beta-helix repeat protein